MCTDGHEAIFFDFDGVILDSAGIKTQAFSHIFQQYGSVIVKAVIEYHLANEGISRYKKFNHIYKYILNMPINEDTLRDLGQKFNQFSLNQILSAQFIDGAMDTLHQLREQGIPAFVASGTPQEELQFIVEERTLASYFMEVHGSPRKKEDIILDVCARHNLDPGKCLFIGDALTDYEAAKKAGTRFLGIVTKAHEFRFPEGTEVSMRVSLSACCNPV